MNLQHLTYFMAIAQEEHFTRAAQRLHVSQPALSRAISSMEEELGAPLFEKCGRNVQLTEYGKVFLRYVEQGTKQIELGVEEVRNMSHSIGGVLHICSVYGYSICHLPELISRFGMIYPNVTFVLKQVPTRLAISETRAGNSDITFLCDTPLLHSYTDMEHQFVHRENLVLAVPEGHFLADRDSVTIQELANETFVSHDETAGTYHQTCKIFEEAGLDFRPTQRASDDATLLGLVRNDRGLAIIFYSSARMASGIVPIPITGSDKATMDVLMSVKKKDFYSPTVKAFINFVKEYTQVTEPRI